MKTIKRMAAALERIASALERLSVPVDPAKRVLRMTDTDRAKVYSEHLGKNLSRES